MNPNDVIIGELERLLGKSVRDKPRVLLPCPWHSDKTPSLVVTIKGKGPTGTYYCFGCGACSKTHGGWNGLAEVLHLQRIDGKGYLDKWTGKAPAAKDFLTDEITVWGTLLENWGIEKDEPLKPGYSFRGIEYPLLKRIQATTALDNYGKRCTLLPVIVGGELVGGVKAINKPTPETKRKYLNAAGTWSHTMGLFPLHVQKRWPWVVLVEGPRDAMWLLQNGIPALAILGTKSWSSSKRDLLLSAGCEFCFIAGDGDAAGQEMNALIFDSLRGFIPRRRIKLPKNEDPASISLEFWQGKLMD